MSLELKMILNKVAEEDKKQQETEFEEGINRYKSLLLQVAQEKKLDVTISNEGISQKDSNIVRDLVILEKAQLINGQTKYTHRNEYRQYQLTLKGAELVEKLSKENNTPKY